ncbi:hypothetical protein [Lysinibacillus sp. TE18511]
MEWRVGDSLGISNRGTKAKSITSCDNAFVTNILLPRRPQEALLCAKAKRQQQCFICAKAKRQQQCFICAKAKRQQQCFICAKAKRQQQMFYLRESEASAAKRPDGTEINY